MTVVAETGLPYLAEYIEVVPHTTEDSTDRRKLVAWTLFYANFNAFSVPDDKLPELAQETVASTDRLRVDQLDRVMSFLGDFAPNTAWPPTGLIEELDEQIIQEAAIFITRQMALCSLPVGSDMNDSTYDFVGGLEVALRELIRTQQPAGIAGGAEAIK